MTGRVRLLGISGRLGWRPSWSRTQQCESPPGGPTEGVNQELPRALITSITAQDGLYLGVFLAAKGYEVFGMARGSLR
jgi:hypothetical protein